MRERRCDPAYPVPELAEIASGEDTIFKEVQEKGVYVRSNRLYCIERERIPIPLIGM